MTCAELVGCTMHFANIVFAGGNRCFWQATFDLGLREGPCFCASTCAPSPSTPQPVA